MSDFARNTSLSLEEKPGPGDLVGIKAAIDTIEGKWKLPIIRHLHKQTKRYGELRGLLPQVTEKMLIQQLRELEEDGITVRTAYPTNPPKVEYTLTEHAETLCPMMQALSAWGKRHLEHRREMQGIVGS
jgi:DNA-binding HxlR family transcriptional regulator